MRSDDIALIVLCYRVTDFKNKHPEQVWPLLVKYIQIRQLIQLLRSALLKPAHYPMYAHQALNCAWWLKPPPLPLPQSSFLLVASFLHSNSHHLSLSLSANTSLSPCANNVPLHNPNPNSHKPTSSSMPSSGNVTISRCSSSTSSSTQGSKRARRALSLANLPISMAALPAPTTGMGFNFCPLCPLFPCHSSSWKV